MDEEAMLAQQKEQCIFCKIVKGDIPAKKVYEDDTVMAVLDINPAKKGHVLLLPKEHYPILPLIPFPQMQLLFKRTFDVANAVKDALLCSGVSVFIANGGAAGQQSPHFILHIIPREEQDFFSGVQLPVTGDKEANDALIASLDGKMSGMMQAYLHETKRESFALSVPKPVPSSVSPVPQEKAVPPKEVVVSTSPSDDQLDKLIAMINENDDLKDALLYRVDEVKEAVKNSPKWADLFKGVDIDKLSNNLQVMASAQAKRLEDEKGDDNVQG